MSKKGGCAMTRAEYTALRRRRFENAREYASIQRDRAYGYGQPADAFNYREAEALASRLDCGNRAEQLAQARTAARRRRVLEAIADRNFWRDRPDPRFPPDNDPILASYNREIRASLHRISP